MSILEVAAAVVGGVVFPDATLTESELTNLITERAGYKQTNGLTLAVIL